MGALGWTEGCVEVEEELASPCVDWPLIGDGESRAGNVGLHREPRKVPDPCSTLSGPGTGEGLAGMLMGLWGGGRIREAGAMLGVGSKGPF